jgi:hypothetical protein
VSKTFKEGVYDWVAPRTFFGLLVGDGLIKCWKLMGKDRVIELIDKFIDLFLSAFSFLIHEHDSKYD